MKRNLEKVVFQIILKNSPQKVAALIQEVGVSGVTIRKVLASLEKKGVVRRSHGEARAFDGDEIPFRMGANFDAKSRIAKIAASFIEPGDTIFLEAGSTVSILADLIKDEQDLTVITPNLFIARIFRGTQTKVIVLGGLYQEASESMVGPLTKAALGQVAFSKCFLGVTGFTRSAGFTLNDSHRAEITQVLLSRGAKNFVLADSSKFGASHLAPIGSKPCLIHTVITDENIPESDQRYLEESGITVVKA